MELGLFEIANYNRGQQFVHALLVGNIGVASAPDEKEEIEEFADSLVLEEIHFLVGSFNVFMDFLS